jgi:hypothetical protein
MKISESAGGRAGWVLWYVLLLGLSFCLPITLRAQNLSDTDSGGTSLPDAPRAATQAAPNTEPSTTSRFIGYASNRSFFFPDLADSPGPLSTGEKFKLFVNQSISPPYLLAAAFSAAYSQARDVPQAYGEGWNAYGSRYGAAIARASSSSFFSSFVFASLLHQDPRFFPQENPTFGGSLKYSARRILITRTDSGREQFNWSGLLGPMAAETLANAYLPASEQNAAQAAERYGVDLAWRFAGNMFKNYWPTIFHSMKLNRLRVIPDPGSGSRPN